jgi:signal transduction histidine kinase
MQALHGETVVIQTDEANDHYSTETELGSVIFEVYFPLINSKGEVIAVGEIYCSIELIMARTARMLADTEGIRFASLLAGLAGLLVLVDLAHRRIRDQEQSLAASLRLAEDFALRNKHLLDESERLRVDASRTSDALHERIGIDLHEGPIQLLTAFALYQGQLARNEAGMPLACKANDLVDRAVTELRLISSGLLLPVLDGLDLFGTLKLAVQTFQDDSGTKVDFTSSGVESTLHSETRAAVFRIVCEALHNARKHANGRGVSVSVEREGGRIVIVVADAGLGFLDKGNSPATHGCAKLGLVGMRNRAKSIGATLEVFSRPGLGTQVCLVLAAGNADDVR